MELKPLSILIDQQGAMVREEPGSYDGRNYIRRYQVGRMEVETKDGPMQQPVRIALGREDVGYKPGEYAVASASFERDSKSGKLAFTRLVLAPVRAVAAAVKSA